MKTLRLAPIFSAVLLTSAFAQSPSNPSTDGSARTMPATSPREGFTLRGTEAIMTRAGVSAKMDQEVRFPNGLRVLPDGTVTLPDGSTTALRANQILTFDGVFQDVTVIQAGVAPLQAVTPMPAATADVGISARDGITISGTEVFLTQNGVMQKVTSDVRMSNGVVVQADGTIISENGNKVTLRANQVLGLDGVLREAPVRPNPAGPNPALSSPSR